MTTPHPQPRYAVYYSPPPDSPIGCFGVAWFGWNHHFGRPAPSLPLARLTREQYLEATAAPRRYGFHATLKAPFCLAPGWDESTLCDALAAFSASRPRMTLPGLRLESLSGFVALVPTEIPPGLHDLADAAVTQLDRCRSAIDPVDAARRRAAGLTERQEALLEAWGYPYVFEEWSFHMTLTDTLKESIRQVVLEELEPVVAAFAAQPVPIDAVVLFRQPNRETPFTVLRVFPLRDGTE
jgi:putative phosphonate metabolism protein